MSDHPEKQIEQLMGIILHCNEMIVKLQKTRADACEEVRRLEKEKV